MSERDQINLRLSPPQVVWLDQVAERRRKELGNPTANRSDVVRELIAWAMREGFFGKGKKR
jgi:hypothetical protein